MMKLPGTIVPPLTPFTPDLRVDYDALKVIVDYVVERCDAAMVVAAGVEAQEYQYLPSDERKELIRHTVEVVNGRRPVAVGVSHPSFKVAIELAHFAERLGASAIQILAPQKPTGGTPTTAELVRYFELIGRETSLPIILYLNPGPGFDVSIPATVELSKLDQVKYIKESSRDLARVGRLITEIELAGHARYFTTLQMLLITLQLGGSGITLPPPAAELARYIIAAYVAGDRARAAELQQQFSLFPSRWMEFGLAAVMKATANHLGLPAGLPYPPYAPVSGERLDALHRYLATTAFARREHAYA
jgi:4-hydroxy-tetrahydrodipicolinate synthase